MQPPVREYVSGRNFNARILEIACSSSGSGNRKDTITESEYISLVEAYDVLAKKSSKSPPSTLSKSQSSSTDRKLHPGMPDQVGFDRSNPRSFNLTSPPPLSSTQIYHLDMMCTCPQHSWYCWQMMPIWSLVGKSRVVYGVESLFRTRSGGPGQGAPWMDLVQLKHPSNRSVYITWKLAEVLYAKQVVRSFPKTQRVFVNTLAIDILDDPFYVKLMENKGSKIVLEFDESSFSWPSKPSEYGKLWSRIGALRKRGYSFALDDVGDNRLVDASFVQRYIKHFDFVKFSFRQCTIAFSRSKEEINLQSNHVSQRKNHHQAHDMLPMACKRMCQKTSLLRLEECKRIRNVWERSRISNPSIKFVLEFSLTESMKEEMEYFPCEIWGSSEWLIQGGVTAEKAYPASIFAGLEKPRSMEEETIAKFPKKAVRGNSSNQIMCTLRSPKKSKTTGGASTSSRSCGWVSRHAGKSKATALS
ncbi:hypothetical protein AAMO2058_001441800 [Amorphochlora amoebiformis]